jgi:glycerophosphoryl diester phosphodiesterase
VRVFSPRYFIVLVAVLLVAGCDNTPQLERSPIETRRPNLDILTVAHRGAEKFAPENTLPGIEKAIEFGFDYVELDVRYTSDRVPVLMHDAVVDRTTDGTGSLSELSFDEVRQLDAGSWFGKEYAGTRVPLLEEALAIMQGKVCVYWDTKDLPDEQTLRLFEKYGFERDCIFISFGGLGGYRERLEIPEWLVEHWPTAPLLPLARKPEDIAKVLEDYPNVRGVHVMRWLLSEELIDEAHAYGLLVFSSTTNKADGPESYARMAALGLDVLMLNNIDLYKNYFNEVKQNLVPADE